MASSRQKDQPQVIYIVAPGARIVTRRALPSQSAQTHHSGPLGDPCDIPPPPPAKGPGYSRDSKENGNPSFRGFFLDRYVY